MITAELQKQGLMTEHDEQYLNEIIHIIATVWNSPEFKQAVMYYKFKQTSDSNQKIYDTVTAVSDKIFKIGINPVSNGSETASTNVSTGVTMIQLSWLQKCYTRPSDLVNTISHEYTHTPEGGGFVHSYLYSRWIPWTWGRPNSVPYGIGDITQQVAIQLKLV